MNPNLILKALEIETQTTNFPDYVANWEKLKVISKYLTGLEMDMRKIIFAEAFKDPKEGANTTTLPSGIKLKGTHKITRNIDESQISLARSEYVLANSQPVDFDELLKTKYELVTASYRKLTEGTQAYNAASRMIVAKPGSPTLDLG